MSRNNEQHSKKEWKGKRALEAFPDLFAGAQESVQPSPGSSTLPNFEQQPRREDGQQFGASLMGGGTDSNIPYGAYDHELLPPQSGMQSPSRHVDAFSLPSASSSFFNAPRDAHNQYQTMNDSMTSSHPRLPSDSMSFANNDPGSNVQQAQINFDAELAQQFAAKSEISNYEYNSSQEHDVQNRIRRVRARNPKRDMDEDFEQHSEEEGGGVFLDVDPEKEDDDEEIDENQVFEGNNALKPWEDCQVPLTMTTTQQAKTANARRIDKKIAAIAGDIFTGIPVTEEQKRVYVERVVFCILNLNEIHDSLSTGKSAYKRFKVENGKRFYTTAQIQIAAWQVVNEAIDRQKGVRKLHVTLRTLKPVTEFETFEARMNAVCSLLYKWKAACQDLFIHGEVGILRIVDAPTQELGLKGTNKKNNTGKKATIDLGRKVQQKASTKAQKAATARTSKTMAAASDSDTESEESGEEEFGQSMADPKAKATPKSRSKATAKAKSVVKATNVTPSKRGRSNKHHDSDSDDSDMDFKPSPAKRKSTQTSGIHNASRSSVRRGTDSKRKQPDPEVEGEDLDAEGETDPEYQKS